jgi:hypothetical protein
MKNKHPSTTLCKSGDKYLSGWESAILAAKERILELRRSIQTFEELRDSGMPFPEPEGRGENKSGHRKPLQ